MFRAQWVWSTALLVACSASEPVVGDAALARVVVEVSYESGAEPYTGATPGGQDTWSLFEANARALFEGTGVTVENPNTLAAMRSLGALDETDFSIERLLELDNAHREGVTGGDTLVFHAMWVDGYLFADGERQSGVIGVSIGRTGTIAMFKPVIETLGFTEVVRRFGEQTTLIHEVGHAVGLVNNGVEMVEAHQDEANGAHCSSDRCVMYWANEGVGDLTEFVAQYVTDGSSVVFDDACLADVRGAFVDSSPE